MRTVPSLFTAKRIDFRSILIFTSIFVLLLCFYLIKNKLYLFDTDDWVNVSMNRSFFPNWGGYNPAKVLPETLLPIVTYVGHYLVYPFTHDLVISSHIVYSVLLSVLITLNVFCFVKIISKDNFLVKLIASIFVLSVLATFCYKDGSNTVFLLSNSSVTTIFHYNITVLANCLAVFYLLAIGNSFTLQQSKKKTILQAFALYYVVFSNLYANVIIVAYSASIILQYLYKVFCFKKKTPIVQILPYIYIAVLWIISAFFEYNGGRAKDIETNFSDYFLLSIENVALAYKTINSAILFVFCIITVVAVFKICLYKSENEYIKKVLGIVVTCFIAWAALVVYLCFLGSKTGPGYILGTGTRLALYFYPLLIVCYLLSIQFCLYKKVSTAFIVVCSIVLIYQFSNSTNSIRNANCPGLSPNLAYAIIEDMHQQLIHEVQQNKSQVIIKVPKFQHGTDNNWPLSIYRGHKFAKAFYRFGELNEKYDAKFIVDYSKNIEFGLIDQKK